VPPAYDEKRLRKMAEVTALDLDDARKRLAMIIDLAAAGD
jgi:hypothetical protein